VKRRNFFEYEMSNIHAFLLGKFSTCNRTSEFEWQTGPYLDEI
jgi:hypothetical protein